MSIHAARSNDLKKVGKRLGREGMSLRAIAAVNEFDGSYKGAMILAGRLKAIAQMAKCDDYWDEQVSKGYYREYQSPANHAVPATKEPAHD